MRTFCHIGGTLASTLALLAGSACSDDPARSDTAGADTSDATTADADATSPDTSETVGGCATGLSAAMSGTWGMEETQTALVQVDPFGTMTQVSTSLYLAKVSGDASQLTLTLCDWQTTDDAGLFTTRMGDTVLQHLDPFVRTLHVAAESDGTVSLKVPEGIALRGVALDHPATDTLPSEASDARVIDQDQDGEPGISLVISGTLQGKLYALHRHRAALDGCFTAADEVSGLTAWQTEQVILGSNPESLSASKPVATTHPDASLSHFTMVKIDDAADCAALIAERSSLF
ncbi:MAG: hypothetical protein U1F43_19150 [Myxococcota bacterium]